MINKRLASVGGLLLVIALSASVISANSIEPMKQQSDSSASSIESAPKEQAAITAQKRQPEALLEVKKSDSQPEAAVAPKQAEESPAKQAESTADAADTPKDGRRKAKSADSAAPEQKPAVAATATTSSTTEEKVASDKATSEPAAKAKPDSAAKPTSSSLKAAAQKQSALSAKSGTSKSKLPANLGTVTSTGSGGHYMSKHDAYSAIAEKHGALAHDAMRKSDKRHLHSSGGGNPFSGSIQKASGLGEMLNPFKGVTDSGLARTLGASMRSIMKSKYSVPAYMASALLGAVALMAFYESPISPLPVPALPNPPVGRFPPEMPNISPSVQVPFRTNQQSYNQRSITAQQQPLQHQHQQVFFPGNGPQQRQMPAGSGSGSPVASLAANLLASVAKPQQNAQRKSAIDYDPSTSRSLFGNNSPFAVPQKAAASPTANHQQRQSNAFLSFFSFGGSDQHHSAGSHQMASNPIEPKGSQHSSQASSAAAILSNSHMINKVKSYFKASGPTGSSSSAGVSNSNPYDQYQRMSFVQALMKDTAFLPGFLTSGNRKSSSSPVASSAATGSASASASAPASASQAAKPSESSAGGANQQVAAAARMQVANEGQLPKQQQQQQQPGKSSPSSYGIVRVAHALLESLSSGIAQRNSQPSERKSNSDEHQSIVAATSLLSDLVSGYNANIDHQQVNQHHSQQQQQQQQQQQSPQGQQAVAPQQQQQPQQQSQSQTQQHSDTQPQAQARSDDDEPTIITADDQLFTSAKKTDEKQQVGALVRKTRSIGFEYPVEAQIEQQPSRAAQINNVIDFVADSYAHNRLLFNFVMNQVGLSHAVPYFEQILAPTPAKDSQ